MAERVAAGQFKLRTLNLWACVDFERLAHETIASFLCVALSKVWLLQMLQ